jgi:AcrR family transcriptional regulator
MTEETPVRRRILDAAFSTFIEAGYAATTMLEIARRAHVSKRELYAVVGNKQEMLATCIRERSQRLRPPDDLPEPHDRASLEGALIAVGSGLLRETTQDTVIAAFRLAIAEAVHAPEVAAALDQYGRRTGRAALTAITTRARDHGLLVGDPAEMAERFSALLWGDLMTSLLLRVADPPDPEDIARRATGAAVALVRLYAEPGRS